MFVSRNHPDIVVFHNIDISELIDRNSFKSVELSGYR